MDEILTLFRQAVTVVGTVEMLKNFDKKKKIPGAVWVIVTAAFGILSVSPIVPDWVIDAAFVTSVSTLFYDVILQSIKKGISKKLGGTDE